MRKFLYLFLIIVAFGAKAQTFDTVTVMVYNVLNYGNNSSTGCTDANNKLTDKDGYLKTIFAHVNPDIIGLNEVFADASYFNRITSLALNQNGVTKYKAATFLAQSNGGITNGLIYNSDKFGLKSQKVIFSNVRNVNEYTLYYTDTKGNVVGDTAFLKAIVWHLKAGTATSDANQRKTDAQQLMAYIAQQPVNQNYLLMGDFNIYTSSEEAYQAVTNYSDSKYNFIDPINRPGAWSGNSAFKDVHTQSTRTSGNGCHSGGGADDRLDFILMNNYLLTDSGRMAYLANSYKALGQDGQRFNQSINNPTNAAVPVSVANALYNNADHLPVLAKLVVRKNISSFSRNFKYAGKIQAIISENGIRIFSEEALGSTHIQIQDITGKVLVNNKQIIANGENIMAYPTANWAKGLYILSIGNESETFAVIKMMKN